MQIAINGDLGGGKSRLAHAFAGALGAHLVSTGAIQRRLAAERNLSVLELNQLAETDPAFDKLLREETIRLASEHRDIVFDSRLAFFFLPRALSVHLLTHPLVAGKRVLDVDRGAVESYSSIDEAATGLVSRRALERERYLHKYGVDIGCIENYDLAVQTDLVTELELRDFLVTDLDRLVRQGTTSLYLNPLSIVPLSEAAEAAHAADGCVSILRYGDASFALDGLARLRTAILDGEKFLSAHLSGQDSQLADSGAIKDVVTSRFSLAQIQAWEVSIGTHIPNHYYAGVTS